MFPPKFFKVGAAMSLYKKNHQKTLTFYKQQTQEENNSILKFEQEKFNTSHTYSKLTFECGFVEILLFQENYSGPKCRGPENRYP